MSDSMELAEAYLEMCAFLAGLTFSAFLVYISLDRSRSSIIVDYFLVLTVLIFLFAAIYSISYIESKPEKKVSPNDYYIERAQKLVLLGLFLMVAIVNMICFVVDIRLGIFTSVSTLLIYLYERHHLRANKNPTERGGRT
jgi:formate hydrogenlyase subunit 3/multisubunit Na+/H+ antiporter MnhD subunit